MGRSYETQADLYVGVGVVTNGTTEDGHNAGTGSVVIGLGPAVAVSRLKLMSYDVQRLVHGEAQPAQLLDSILASDP